MTRSKTPLIDRATEIVSWPERLPHSEIVSAQGEVNRANFLVNASYNWAIYHPHMDLGDLSPAKVREHIVNAIGHLQRSLEEYDAKFPPAKKPAPKPREKRGTT